MLNASESTFNTEEMTKRDHRKDSTYLRSQRLAWPHG